jgi:hypothetical protein
MIHRVMRDRAQQACSGDIESIQEPGDRIVVGFRPSERTVMECRPCPRVCKSIKC